MNPKRIERESGGVGAWDREIDGDRLVKQIENRFVQATFFDQLFTVVVREGGKLGDLNIEWDLTSWDGYFSSRTQVVDMVNTLLDSGGVLRWITN